MIVRGIELLAIAILFYSFFKLWYEVKHQPKNIEEERVKIAFKEIMNDLFNATDTVFAKGVEQLRRLVDLSQTVDKLRDEKAKLEIDKSRQEEEWSRREREIEHKVGLERSRQKQELELESKRIRLEVEIEALKQDKKRFEDQMKFHQDRFEKEIKYQRELVEKMVGSFDIRVRKEVRDGEN